MNVFKYEKAKCMALAIKAEHIQRHLQKVG